jgi:NADPH2:quinone reductase
LFEREDFMKAAWYERQGPAREVLTVGDMPDPATDRGELRIRIAASGINPGDIKKRQDFFGVACRTLASSRTAMAQGK